MIITLICEFHFTLTKSYTITQCLNCEKIAGKGREAELFDGRRPTKIVCIESIWLTLSFII